MFSGGQRREVRHPPQSLLLVHEVHSCSVNYIFKLNIRLKLKCASNEVCQSAKEAEEKANEEGRDWVEPQNQ